MALQLWLYFRVTLQLRRYLCGGIPKSPDVIDGWIDTVLKDESRVRSLLARLRAEHGVAEGDTDAATAALQAETMAGMGVTEADRELLKKTAWNGFKANGQGIYYEGRCAKGALKEWASVLSSLVDVWGLKNRVAERIFVLEEEIPLGAREPAGSYESIVHLQDRFGNDISALKRTDYVDRPALTITLKILDVAYTSRKDADKKTKTYSPAHLLGLLLKVGEEEGLGAERGQGHGRFDVVSVEPCAPPADPVPGWLTALMADAK